MVVLFCAGCAPRWRLVRIDDYREFNEWRNERFFAAERAYREWRERVDREWRERKAAQ